MKGYVRSSPHFFRLVKAAFAVGLLALLGLALLAPAPLQAPADFGTVPNPSKSAWFLLWMQELVGYSSYMVYLIAALALYFALLPWLPGALPAERARWWPSEQSLVSWIALATFLGILVLTLLAMFFRGPNWAFVWPF
jgi:hypothetical protein